MLYVEVILPLPLDGTFTYSVPDTLAPQVRMGVRVVVPLGRSKTYTAMAVSTHNDKPEFDTRDILQVVDDSPVLPERQLRLWQWISTYYMCALGDVFKAALPAGLKAEDGYRPKTVRCVTLPANLRTEHSLHIAMTALTRALKQQQTFCKYLELSHWDQIDGETLLSTYRRWLATNCRMPPTPPMPYCASSRRAAFLRCIIVRWNA